MSNVAYYAIHYGVDERDILPLIKTIRNDSSIA